MSDSKPHALKPVSPIPRITVDEFGAIECDTLPDGRIIARQPEHQLTVALYEATRKDPEKYRWFVENVLGGTWIDDPFPVSTSG